MAALRVCAHVSRIAFTVTARARPNTNASAIWVGLVNRVRFRVDAIIIQRVQMDREIVICVTIGRRESTANAVEPAAMEMQARRTVACLAIAMVTAIGHWAFAIHKRANAFARTTQKVSSVRCAIEIFTEIQHLVASATSNVNHAAC